MMRSVLKSLLKPDAYPEATTRVELLQTHVSWIFLTDSHAYKIKKPVDLGFLNFSTIDRRRFYCNEEIRYNRRLCPDIYIGVVELRQTNGCANFRDQGHVIDYAVKMKRLPAESMLDRLVMNNTVSIADIRDVARVIAEFHHTLPTSPAISEYGRPDRIRFNWIENFEQILPFENSTLPAPERQQIRSWVLSFIEQNADLFAARIDNGFIRECDGDIHLENICLSGGKVYIFDCIEFSERFRCCDTTADLAFLLMDLDFRGRNDLSAEVLATYSDVSGDNIVPALLSFYKIYRAFVRGKVESLHSIDPDINEQQRNNAITRAIRYFRLARGYIERSRLRPTLFITCGLMGCGKSTLAAQLSFELGIPSYNSDTIRKQMAGISPETGIRVAFGQGIYSDQATQETYSELLTRAEEELKNGSSVIVDACFISRESRMLFANLAKSYAVSFVILFISCSEAINKRRLSDRSASGRSVSDGRAELLNLQRRLFEAPDNGEGLLIPVRSIVPVTTLCSTIYERLA